MDSLDPEHRNESGLGIKRNSLPNESAPKQKCNCHNGQLGAHVWWHGLLLLTSRLSCIHSYSSSWNAPQLLLKSWGAHTWMQQCGWNKNCPMSGHTIAQNLHPMAQSVLDLVVASNKLMLHVIWLTFKPWIVSEILHQWAHNV